MTSTPSALATDDSDLCLVGGGEANELREALQVISGERRFTVLQLLMRGEHCVCEIVSTLSLPQPLVSYHMKALAKAGLVSCRKHGRWAYYSINKERLAWLNEAFAAHFGVELVSDARVECDADGTPRRQPDCACS